MHSKLYIVSRSDLSPGLVVAQSCHALRAFTAEHPEVDQKWYTESNNIVCLQIANEASGSASRLMQFIIQIAEDIPRIARMFGGVFCHI